MNIILSSFILTLVSTWAFSQADATRIKHFNLKKAVAIEGYDPVSYFQGKPVEGKSDFKFTHKGVTYLFASQTNLNTFKGNATKYEPAYGGWCAYAMGESGEKVKVDPETFKIQDGRLLLFYNFWGNNTLSTWAENEKKLKVSADHNWENIVK